MLLSKEDILKIDDASYRVVEVPEWGGEVKLKTMSVADQIQYEKAQGSEDNTSIIVNLLMLCCVDDAGNALFNKDDLDALQKKNAHILCKLFKEAVSLNSLTQKDVEEQAKNS